MKTVRLLLTILKETRLVSFRLLLKLKRVKKVIIFYGLLPTNPHRSPNLYQTIEWILYDIYDSALLPLRHTGEWTRADGQIIDEICHRSRIIIETLKYDDSYTVFRHSYRILLSVVRFIVNDDSTHPV